MTLSFSSLSGGSLEIKGHLGGAVGMAITGKKTWVFNPIKLGYGALMTMVKHVYYIHTCAV